MKNKMISWLGAATAALTLSGAVSALSADTLRLQAGFWPGELDPELEDRLFLDDLLLGTGLGRFNLGWTDKDTYTIYPLGLSYMRQIGPGKAILSGNYMRFSPEFKYSGIGLSPLSISNVTLVDYLNTNWEGELGYQIGAANNQLFITPKVGYRRSFQEFSYSEFTIGNGTIAFSGDSPFEASAGGTTVGLGLQFYLTKQVSLIFDYVQTAGLWSGSMTQEKLIVGVSGGSALLSWERAEAGYELSMSRYSLGVQFDVDSNLSLQAGIREEKQDVSYPGYFGLPVVINPATGGAVLQNSVDEFITDYIIWQQEETTTKGLVFFSLTYDIDL